MYMVMSSINTRTVWSEYYTGECMLYDYAMIVILIEWKNIYEYSCISLMKSGLVQLVDEQ